MKKIIASIMSLSMTIGGAAVPALTEEAIASPSTVYINGQSVEFEAYLINDNNYIKLRDIAYALNGTEKQFEVGFDNTLNAIYLTSGKNYTPVGGEMEGKGEGNKQSTATSSKIVKDGVDIDLTAYNIDDNNYFKLRDIGAAFDFGVDWDDATKAIGIDTSKGYGEEEAEENDTETFTTDGYEYAEFEKYNVSFYDFDYMSNPLLGNKVYMDCYIKNTEQEEYFSEFRNTYKTSIRAYVVDNNNNIWVAMLGNIEDEDYEYKTFNDIIGESIILKGSYFGPYPKLEDETPNLPSLSFDELYIKKTGKIIARSIFSSTANIKSNNETNIQYYVEKSDVPDFGALTTAELNSVKSDPDGQWFMYSYKADGVGDDAITNYIKVLEVAGYEPYNKGQTMIIHKKGDWSVSIMFASDMIFVDIEKSAY